MRTAALVVAALVLAGCGGGERSEYDAEVERVFIDVCERTRSAPVCRCLYDRIVEEIPFDRFQEVDEQLERDPESLPDDIVRLSVRCATEEVLDE